MIDLDHAVIVDVKANFGLTNWGSVGSLDGL